MPLFGRKSLKYPNLGVIAPFLQKFQKYTIWVKIPHFRRKIPYEKKMPLVERKLRKQPILGENLKIYHLGKNAFLVKISRILNYGRKFPFWTKISEIPHIGRKSWRYSILDVNVPSWANISKIPLYGRNVPFWAKNPENIQFWAKIPLFGLKSRKYPILSENAPFGKKFRKYPILGENTPFWTKIPLHFFLGFSNCFGKNLTNEIFFIFIVTSYFFTGPWSSES